MKCSISRIECEPCCSQCSFRRGGCEVVQGRMEAGQGVAGAAGHLPSNGKGGILYCVVARGATVLARCSKSVAL